MTDTHTAENAEHDDRVQALLRSSKVAMLTYVDPGGKLVSKPMATQDVDFDGTLRFIAERSSEKVQALEADPRVNVSYSPTGRGSRSPAPPRSSTTRPSSRSCGAGSPARGSKAGPRTRTTS